MSNLRNGLLPASQARCRNDEQLSLRGAKRRGNPFLFFSIGNGLLRCTLSVLLAMTMILLPCQAAIEFDGVDDYIETSNNIGINGSAAISISFWMNSDTVTQWGAGVSVGQNTANNIAAIAQGINGSIININHWSGNNRSINISPYTHLNNWLHLTYTYSGATEKLFVNGEQKFSAAVALSFTDNPIRIGGRPGSYAGQYLDGQIDDTRIYSRDLNNGEILALYNSRSKRPSGSLANGLVAHYEMDDKEIGHVAAQAKDNSGNLNHGQFVGFDNLVSNGFSSDVPTNIATGTSINFDGVNDYILSSSNNLDFSNGTIITWINPSLASPGSDEFLVMGSRDPNRIYLLRLATTGNLGLRLGSSANQDSGIVIPNNTWSQAALTWNSGAYNLFLNSNNIGNGAYAGLSGVASCPSIGAYSSACSAPVNSSFFKGKQDDVHIYNRSLTASEISFLYNGSGLDPGTSNLQALWTFDDDSALKDSSGNNNHGIGVGGDSLKYTEGILKR